MAVRGGLLPGVQFIAIQIVRMKTVHVTYLLIVIAYFSFHDPFLQYKHPVVSGGHTKNANFVDLRAYSKFAMWPKRSTSVVCRSPIHTLFVLEVPVCYFCWSSCIFLSLAYYAKFNHTVLKANNYNFLPPATVRIPLVCFLVKVCSH